MVTYIFIELYTLKSKHKNKSPYKWRTNINVLCLNYIRLSLSLLAWSNHYTCSIITYIYKLEAEKTQMCCLNTKQGGVAYCS